MVEVDEFTQNECEKYIAFGKEYYSSVETINLEYINWKFLKNIENKSWHLKSFNGDEINGRAVLNERELNVNRISFSITQVTDLLASPKLKNAATFFNLIRNYKALNSDGVLHTSNESSDVLYSKLFKFKKIFSLSGCGFPIKINNIIRFKPLKIPFLVLSFFYLRTIKLILSLAFLFVKIEVSNYKAYSDIEALVVEFESHNKNFKRDKNFIDWRYFDRLFNYRCRIIKVNRQTCGYYCYRLKRFKDIDFMIIMDVVVAPKISGYGLLMVKLAIIKDAIERESDAVFGLFNLNNLASKFLSRFPFIKISDKILPHSTPIYMSSMSEVISLMDLSDMYFSLSDLDYF